MYILINNFMKNLTQEQVKQFGIQNNTYLNQEELDFTYHFVKENWQNILKNPESLPLEQYKNRFSQENFIKIKNLIQLYYNKYKHLL